MSEKERILIGDYLVAVETRLMLKPDARTTRWVVYSKDDVELPLGLIRWHGAWRCYAFFPAEGTFYEHKCLRALANFLEARTGEQKFEARARRMGDGA